MLSLANISSDIESLPTLKTSEGNGEDLIIPDDYNSSDEDNDDEGDYDTLAAHAAHKIYDDDTTIQATFDEISKLFNSLASKTP